jgi:hypothetical protein
MNGSELNKKLQEHLQEIEPGMEVTPAR